MRCSFCFVETIWKNNPIVLLLFHFDGEIFRGNFRVGEGFERGIGCLVQKLELLESNTVVFFFLGGEGFLSELN